MTIIEFKPSSWEGQVNKTSHQASHHHCKPIECECDSYEFVDCELIEEENEGFFSKLKGLFAPKVKNSMTDKEAYNRAKMTMCDAIVSRNEAASILEMATSADNKKYLWQLHKKGTNVSFEELDINRTMMIERDLQGKVKRKTTFFTRSFDIISIEEPSKNCKGYDKTSFIDSKDIYFEVKKGATSESKMSEFYAFEHGRPLMYKKNCTKTSGGIVGKEEYIF